MQWYILSKAIQHVPSNTVGSTNVELSTAGRGYVGYGRDNAVFSEPPKHSSFHPNPGVTVHVSVNVTAAADGVQAQLCVVCYGSDSSEPIKFWSDMGTPALELKVPENTSAVSVVLLIKGQGELTIAEPVIQEGISLPEWSRTLPVESGRKMRLTLYTRCTLPMNNSGLVAASFRDQNNQVLLPSGDLPINPVMGSYFYLSTPDTNTTMDTTVEFTVPVGAVFLSLNGHAWNASNHVTVIGEPEVIRSEDGADGRTLDESLDWLRALEPDLPLIVLYTTAPPVGHPTLSLRPNRLAVEYRKLGIEVIFFPFSSITDHQRLSCEGVVQFNRTELDQVNAVLSTRRGTSNVFICSSFPDIGALTTIDLLRASQWSTMYEVRDEMEDFNRVGYSKWFDSELERQVIKRVDSIVTVSPRLAEKMRLISRETVEPRVVQNAAPPALIERGEELRAETVVRERRRHRIVGYIGHLTDSWFDWDLVISTAVAHPDFQFEIIGHGMPESIELPKNAVYLGPRTHDEFVEISRRWWVGLIPFQETPLTYAVDPNKVYEYLAVGLRTVTAPMGAVASCPSTYIYNGPEEFASVLAKPRSTDAGSGRSVIPEAPGELILGVRK
ncbi:glycosyltransferase family protein, partial [Kocuria gwangalliensis]